MEPPESINNEGAATRTAYGRNNPAAESTAGGGVNDEPGGRAGVDAAGTSSDIGRVSAPETVVHWFLWTCGCLYSTYRLYRVINEHGDTLDAYGSPGWLPGLGSVDKSDDELEVFIKGQLPVYAVFMVIHLVVGQFLRSLALFKVLPLFHAILAVLFLSFSAGVLRCSVLLGTALAMYAVSRTRSRLLCWAAVTALILFNNNLLRAVVGVDLTDEAEDRSYIATAILMWSICRCVMFCCDQSDRPASLSQHDNIVTFLGYVMYAPTVTGPLILYRDYVASLQSSAVTEPGRQRVRRLAVTLARLFFWLLVLEVSNHLIHFHSLRYSPQDVARLFGRWELAGLNYWSGQYFHIKYVFAYGLACALADFEGIVTPLQPRCVAWITMYSDMWKYFDHGLYKFISAYIYVPLLGSRRPSGLRRTLASVMVFVFVFTWHGLARHIFLWSVANFFCVMAERVAHSAASTPVYVEWRRVVGAGLARRCLALLSAPLFMLSMACQVGFLTNSGALGRVMLAEAVWPPGAVDLLLTLAFMYCACQVALDVKRWRHQRGRLLKEPAKLL